MDIRKMAGWCLILFGVINLLHAINTHATMGREMSVPYIFLTSLLFTAGAAFLWLKKKESPHS